MHTPARSVRANGIDLMVDTFGNANDPPLLLIMGLGAQMIDWDEAFCTELAAHGRFVVRFDNRDIGLSTKFTQLGMPDIGQAMQAALRGQPFKAPYLLSDMADDGVGLLDALGIMSAHVVGASMGGAIAQTMAIRNPSRVRTLTSIMATSGAAGLPPPTPEAMQALLTPTPLDFAGFLDRYLKTWKILRGGSFPEDEARDPERAHAVFERGLNPAGVARQLAAIFASGSRRSALEQLKTPTLVIHGDADPLVPLAHGQDVAAAVPGARLEVIPRMGHALPISMWPQIIAAIVRHTT